MSQEVTVLKYSSNKQQVQERTVLPQNTTHRETVRGQLISFSQISQLCTSVSVCEATIGWCALFHYE
jgi:hypothetical protein